MFSIIQQAIQMVFYRILTHHAHAVKKHGKAAEEGYRTVNENNYMEESCGMQWDLPLFPVRRLPKIAGEGMAALVK